MCIIGRQLIEKSGLLILVNFINLVNLGLQYLSCCWFAPYDTVAPAGVRHTPACRCSHTQPLCRQSAAFPSVISPCPNRCQWVCALWKRWWLTETHMAKRLLSHGRLRLCREVQCRWAGMLKAPGDVMLPAHLWPKAWLKGSKNTSPWPNIGNCFHLPFLAGSLSLLNVDNILYKFPCNSLFQKLSPVI